MNRMALPREGQPVLFLALLAAGWCLVRVLTWSSPWPSAPLLPPVMLAENAADTLGRATRSVGARFAASEPEETRKLSAVSIPAPLSTASIHPAPDIPPRSRDVEAFFAVDRRAMGHHLLFAAGMAQLPMPRSVAAALDETRAARRDEGGLPREKRWRFDGWLVLRPDGMPLADGGLRPASYGASQAGAVVAYRLAPGTPAMPSAYIRASRALVPGGESELAIGLAARPMRALPLTLHAETRVTQRPLRRAEVRPAVFAVAGAEGLRLPGGATARYYAQAGYVGGRFATAFADGAMVAEREVARFDLGEIAVGAGAWGGAQRGAARLDIGPSVTARITLGDVPARIEADYRWRVAGNARPGNGGVLTLSTGF